MNTVIMKNKALQFYTVGRISIPMDQDLNNRLYYAIAPGNKEEMVQIQCRDKLAIGKFYEHSNGDYSSCHNFYRTADIGTFINIETGTCTQISPMQVDSIKDVDVLLHSISKKFASSVQCLIDYNVASQGLAQAELNKQMFDSPSELFANKQSCNNVTVLAGVIERDTNTSGNAFVWTAQTENNKFSIVQWGPGKLATDSRWVSGNIASGQPAVFGNLDFVRADAGFYFNVKKETFIISDLAPRLRKILVNDDKDYPINNINVYWLNPVSAAFVDRRLIKTIKKIRCETVEEAQKAVEYKREFESRVVINCKRLADVTNIKTLFRTWCPTCSQNERFLRRQCVHCGSAVKAKWHGEMNMKIDPLIRGYQQIKMSRIGVSLQEIGKMHKYCANHNISSPQLAKVIDFIESKLAQREPVFNMDPESAQFVPLISAFMEAVKGNSAVQIELSFIHRISKKGNAYFIINIANIMVQDDNAQLQGVLQRNDSNDSGDSLTSFEHTNTHQMPNLENVGIGADRTPADISTNNAQNVTNNALILKDDVEKSTKQTQGSCMNDERAVEIHRDDTSDIEPPSKKRKLNT